MQIYGSAGFSQYAPIDGTCVEIRVVEMMAKAKKKKQ